MLCHGSLLAVQQGKLPLKLAVISPGCFGCFQVLSILQLNSRRLVVHLPRFPFPLGIWELELCFHAHTVYVLVLNLAVCGWSVVGLAKGFHDTGHPGGSPAQGETWQPLGGPLGEGVCFCVVIATWWSPVRHGPL